MACFLKCAAPGCNNPDPRRFGIAIYDEKGVKGDEEFICHHHFLVRNFSLFLALKRVNPKIYDLINIEAEKEANRIPDDFINNIFGIVERKA